jgi:ELWxxDGT repeat protein
LLSSESEKLDGTRIVICCYSMSKARLVATLATLLILVALTGPSAGQQIDLVADLRTSGAVSSVLTGGAAIPQGLLFAVERPYGPWELWLSDGSADGTGPVSELPAWRFRDGWPSAWGSLPDVGLFSVGGVWWRSDGTDQGTYELLQFCEAPCGHQPYRTWTIGGRAFLLTDAGTSGSRVWASDGTPESTRLFADLSLRGLGTAFDVLPIGDRLLFVVSVAEGDTWEFQVWVADGSDPAPHRLGTIELNGLPGTSSLGTLGSEAALVLGRVAGEQTPWLYRTDGRALDRVLELSTHASAEVGLAGSVSLDGGALLFVQRAQTAREPLTCELWRTHGTASGTERIQRWMFESCPRISGDPASLALGDRAVFFRSPNGGSPRGGASELWASDGTSEGTKVITGLEGTLLRSAPVPFEGLALFGLSSQAEGASLWVSDGTPEGTQRLRSFPSDNELGAFGVAAGRSFFAADDGTTGRELWSTDGTAVGTEQVVNLTSDETASSSPRFLVAGDALYFVADDEAGRAEVFRYDGLDAPRRLGLTEEASPISTEIQEVVGETGGRVLVLARDRDQEFGGLWSVDPQQGTAKLLLPATAVDQVVRLDERLLLSVHTFVLSGPGIPTPPDSLWITDGTTQGTHLLSQDIFSPVADPKRPWGPTSLVSFAGRGYFLALSATLEHSLWSTDGTTEGTVPIVGISAVTEDAELEETRRNSDFRHLVSWNGGLALWFRERAEPPRLLLSDGTAAGTTEVVLGDAQPSEVSRAFALRGRIFWLALDSLDDWTFSLWSLDPASGAPAAPTKLGSFTPLHGVTPADRSVFIPHTEPDGRVRLFATDGTVPGTREVDLGAFGSNVEGLGILEAIDGGVLLVVATPERGSELAYTDGTRSGTYFLPEINPGPDGSNPTEVEVWGDRVFVSAFRPDVGQELFAFDRSLLVRPCVESHTTACLQGGRFEVEAEWTDPANGEVSAAKLADTTDDTAVLWFFEPDNLEVAIKVLDGRAINDHHWVYGSGLTDLRVRLTVRDVESGEVRVFHRAAGETCGFADIEAFHDLGGATVPATTGLRSSAHSTDPRLRSTGTDSPDTGSCGQALCLHNGRFRVEANWLDPSSSSSAMGASIPATDQSGHFWFFAPENLELTVKLLDGRSINGAWWLFHAPATDLPYTLRIVDTATGEAHEIAASGGNLCGGIDLDLFREGPDTVSVPATRLPEPGLP